MLYLKSNAGLPTNAYWQSKIETFLIDSYRNSELAELRAYWMNMSGIVMFYLMVYANAIPYPFLGLRAFFIFYFFSRTLTNLKITNDAYT